MNYTFHSGSLYLSLRPVSNSGLKNSETKSLVYNNNNNDRLTV